MDQFPRYRGQDGQFYTDDYFVYNIGPGVNGAAGNLAAAATANSNLNIQADSSFEWWYTTWYAEENGSTPPNVDNLLIPVSLLITDGGSGRNLFNQAMPISTLAGPGREPYPVPKKRIFMGKSTVNFFWTNFGAVTYNNISLSLHGRKIFTLS
jgi:hypothetical protein